MFLEGLIIPAGMVSPYTAWEHCDHFGRAIVLLLFIFSTVTWTIMIEKGIMLYRSRKGSVIFAHIFREKKTPLQCAKIADQHQGSVVFVYQAGIEELLTFYGIPLDKAELYGTERYPKQRLTTAQIETVRSTLERSVADQILKLEDKVGLLATAVSVSPFLGLLGTVWGVMMAFCGIALQGTTSISAIAPGVSGALLATTVGLLVAIPSLVGYNLTANAIKNLTVLMDNFVEEFMAKVKLEQHEVPNVQAVQQVPQNIPQPQPGQPPMDMRPVMPQTLPQGGFPPQPPPQFINPAPPQQAPPQQQPPQQQGGFAPQPQQPPSGDQMRFNM